MGLILVVLMPNSFINVSISYFLHTTITLLAALSAGTNTKSSCSLFRVSFTSGSLRIFCFGDRIFSFKLEIRSTTNSLIWSFHSERYLRSTCSCLDHCPHRDQTIVSIDCQLILLGSRYLGPLATSSLNLIFSMTIKSPVITWPCGS